MSKAKKSTAKKGSHSKPRVFHAPPGFVRGRTTEIKEHLRDPEFIFKDLPPAINKAVSTAAEDLAWSMIKTMPELAEAGIDERTGVRVVAALAVEMGFAMALYRFSDRLQDEPELSEWQNEGQKKGHETQSQARESRYQRIRDKWAEMESAGARVTNETVAAAMRQDGEKKCSVRTVQRAFAAAAQQGKPTSRAIR
jgi:hypothetical protein